MLYNKRRMHKTGVRKILHKVGRFWITVSIAFLSLIGAKATAAHISANAATLMSNHNEDNANHQIDHRSLASSKATLTRNNGVRLDSADNSSQEFNASLISSVTSAQSAALSNSKLNVSNVSKNAVNLQANVVKGIADHNLKQTTFGSAENSAMNQLNKMISPSKTSVSRNASNVKQANVLNQMSFNEFNIKKQTNSADTDPVSGNLSSNSVSESSNLSSSANVTHSYSSSSVLSSSSALDSSAISNNTSKTYKSALKSVESNGNTSSRILNADEKVDDRQSILSSNTINRKASLANSVADSAASNASLIADHSRTFAITAHNLVNDLPSNKNGLLANSYANQTSNYASMARDYANGTSVYASGVITDSNYIKTMTNVHDVSVYAHNISYSASAALTLASNASQTFQSVISGLNSANTMANRSQIESTIVKLPISRDLADGIFNRLIKPGFDRNTFDLAIREVKDALISKDNLAEFWNTIKDKNGVRSFIDDHGIVINRIIDIITNTNRYNHAYRLAHGDAANVDRIFDDLDQIANHRSIGDRSTDIINMIGNDTDLNHIDGMRNVMQAAARLRHDNLINVRRAKLLQARKTRHDEEVHIRKQILRDKRSQSASRDASASASAEKSVANISKVRQSISAANSVMTSINSKYSSYASGFNSSVSASIRMSTSSSFKASALASYQTVSAENNVAGSDLSNNNQRLNRSYGMNSRTNNIKGSLSNIRKLQQPVENLPNQSVTSIVLTIHSLLGSLNTAINQRNNLIK